MKANIMAPRKTKKDAPASVEAAPNAPVSNFTPDVNWILGRFPDPSANAYIDPFEYTPYLTAGLMTADTNVVAPNGAHQCALTQAGIDWVSTHLPGAAPADANVSTNAATVAASTPKAKAPMFEIDTNVPKPVAARRGRGESRYPFEKMEVGHSFHIAATADKPTPARDYASSISSATKRLEPKRFSIRPVGEDDPRGVGARVFRDPDYTAQELAALAVKRSERAKAKAAKPHAVGAAVAQAAE